jgi:hypothetical protein
MFRKKHKQTDPTTKSKADYWTPLVVLLIVAAFAYWSLEIRKPSSYGVCLQGFNHTTRGISEYRVNGDWGGNIPPKDVGDEYGGGGGFSCGSTIKVGTVTVKWNYARKTREAIERGDPPETHEVTMPMPEAESNHSRYFQVHIFPDNHVELKLSDHS